MPDTLIPPGTLPADLQYLVAHQVWARLHDDGTATVGITELGIRLSGEVYMCRAKRVGTELAQADTVAVVELSKAIVAVKSPVSGTIIAVNEALDERPELVHRDPYGTGWIARLRLSDLAADQSVLLQGAAATAAMAHHAWLHRAELVPATAMQVLPAPQSDEGSPP